MRSMNRFGDDIDSICGAADESQEVEQYDGSLGVSKEFVSMHQKKVGQVQWNDNLHEIYTDPGNLSGRRWMSGTLLANDYFLTVGHCFDNASLKEDVEFLPKVNGTNRCIESKEIAINMHVNFNYQTDPEGNLRQEDSFPIVELCEFRLLYVDYAIARLGKNNNNERPADKYGYAPISNKDANLDEIICIIGHPKDAYGNTTKKIAAGKVTLVRNCPIFENCYFGYNAIDTSNASSGSGVLRDTNGEVVGIHVMGYCERDRGFNYALKISTLLQASPILKNLCDERN
jgi:V8-like Glu-specific endopeptidase